MVTVHYTGWTTDGKMFDSSYTRKAPATFGVNRVIPGWTEGVQLMVVGEKRRFWIPEKLAYKGTAGRPEGMLVFDVELMDYQSAPDRPRPPTSRRRRRTRRRPQRARLQGAAAGHRARTPARAR